MNDELKAELKKTTTDEAFDAELKNGIDYGAPTFPASVAYGPSGDRITSGDMGEPGIHARDYYAAIALQGMLSADGNDPRWIGKDTGPEFQRGGGKWLDPLGVALQAFEIGEAMVLVGSLSRDELDVARRHSLTREELEEFITERRKARTKWLGRRNRPGRTKAQ